MALNFSIALLLSATIILIVAGIIAYLVFEFLKKKKLNQSLDKALFLVKMPRHEGGEESGRITPDEIRAKIAAMEQFYANFLYLQGKGEFLSESLTVALEIASETGGEDISFYVAVPNKIENSLEKYVQGVYPNAVVEKVPEDYTIFEPENEAAAAYLTLSEPSCFAINTYKKLETDPLTNITNALSKIYPNEGAAFQIILRPASFNLKKSIDGVISLIKKGESAKEAIKKAYPANLSGGEAIKAMNAAFSTALSEARKKPDDQNKPVQVDDIAIAALQEKAQKPGFEANVRIVSSAKEKQRAEEILESLKSAFSQFASSFNSFRVKDVKKAGLNKFIYNYVFRNFDPKQKIVLNLEELSSIFHFPLPHIESPNIKWAKTKEVAPPSNLPASGEILIGKTVFRSEERPVYIASKNDRRRHFYIIGQTGTGKSSLLREMIRQDIENGEGVGVIDPHGDLVEDTLANVPRERVDDVVLFEPFDTERPCGLNMLEWDTPQQKDFAVSEMIAIFSKLFPPEMIGPMFEHYMRNAMLALMADKDNPGTLVEIPRIFTDDNFMEEKLSKVQDPLVRSFWLGEWKKTTGHTKSDMLGYVVSKVGRFVENEMMRNIIGQAHSGFNLEQVINNKKIFLANLSKGLTGEMNSSLLGLILISKIQIAAMRRGTMPLEERKDFYLYIDEFQNFTTDSIATILSEARKYRLNLILAHQFIPQLSEEIRNAVIGNVGNICSFRVGADDAEFLEKQFMPEFSRFDLLNLDNFQFIGKMMINNILSSPFKVKTIMPKEGNPQIVEAIKKLSRLKYSRPKHVVEQEILERSNFGEV